jgi:hypothetical protein
MYVVQFLLTTCCSVFIYLFFKLVSHMVLRVMRLFSEGKIKSNSNFIVVYVEISFSKIKIDKIII